jgi:hypothetical protein
MAGGVQSSMDRNPFRTAWTIPEGPGIPLIHEARILDVNMVNWTVDCFTVFDQKRFFDIQVSSPYMHSNRGEGFFALPEVGAKCLVCVPSDGPPPFVLAFIMPAEGNADGEGSTFRGGRLKGSPGDMGIRGRDGNFVVLHRGGVLQVGATPLAQRIYIPLGNMITDVSQNYTHFNSGGAVKWGLRAITDEDDQETEFTQVFRVYADDEFADVRLSVGKVHSPVPEPTGDAGSSVDLSQLGIGSALKVLEFVLAPGGFDGSDGTQQSDTKDLTKLRIFFDRDGNAMFRSEGSVSFRTKGKLRIRADDGFEVFTKESMTLEAEKNLRLQGKNLELATDGGTVSLNGGSKPVAHVGSQVLMTVVAPIPIKTTAGEGIILTGATFSGQVSTGNPTVKV